MDVQHIYRIAAIEAENQRLIAKNQANEKVIEFLLAQLVQISSVQRLSEATQNDATKKSTQTKHAPTKLLEDDLLSDAQLGSDRYGEQPPPLLRSHDNDALDKCWDVLTPLPSSDVGNYRTLPTPAEDALPGSDQTPHSLTVVPAYPAHPAFQASAMPKHDDGSLSSLPGSNQHPHRCQIPVSSTRDCDIDQQHIAATSNDARNPSRKLNDNKPAYAPLSDRSHGISSAPSTSSRKSVGAASFMPTAWNLGSRHSTDTKRFSCFKSIGPINASEEKGDLRSVLMYQPSQHDKDTKRTVIMKGFPLTGKVSDLLSQVHTGRVYSLTLCNTSAITGGVTVLLIFLHEEAARKLVSDTADNCIAVPDMHGVEHALNIQMLDSATYPIPRHIHRRITEQGATRVVQFSRLPSDLTCQAFSRVISESGTLYHGLVSVTKNDNDQFIAEFTGVANAVNAVGRLLNHPAFRNAIWAHLPDPCDGDVDAEQSSEEAEESENGMVVLKASEDSRMEDSKVADKAESLKGTDDFESDKDE